MYTAISQLKDIYQADMQSNDLVLLDFSVNDQFEYAMPWNKDIESIEFGVESLVRHLLSKDVAVVLLENWPLGMLKRTVINNNGTLQSNVIFGPLSSNTIDYTLPYRKIAKYYQLPIWSYRSAVWDKFTDEYQVSK